MASSRNEKEKRQRDQERRRLERIRHNLKRGPAGERELAPPQAPRPEREEGSGILKRFARRAQAKGITTLINPAGREKMSEVLDDFVQPYYNLIGDDTLESRRKMLTLAVAAWNVTLLPEDQQEEQIDSLIEKGMPGLSRDDKKAARSLIQSMIDWKQSQFADNKRFIMSFELTETQEGYHLAVASTL